MSPLKTIDAGLYATLVSTLKGNKTFTLKETKSLGAEFLKIQPAVEPALYRAFAAVRDKTAATDLGLRKAVLKEALSSLTGVEGLSFYILEAGIPKLFYPVGKSTFFPIEIPECGFYTYGNEVLVFDHQLTSSHIFTISEETGHDTLFFPIRKNSHYLGMLVAQGKQGEHIYFNCEKFFVGHKCALPENNIPILIRYFEDLAKLYTIIMSNWFDGTTGLLNRHCFESELYPSMLRWLEKGMNFTILFMDLDRFKAVNDHLGHSAGDEFLKIIGEIMVKSTKSTSVLSGRVSSYPDFFIRYGGDEFVGILQNTNCETALNPVRRLQERIATVKHSGHSVSASIGMLDSAYIRKELEKGEFHIIEEIDKLLYKSKANAGGISYVAPDGTLQTVE